jgi:CheY-like chemotaxis protein
MQPNYAPQDVLLAEDDVDDVLIFRLALNKIPIVISLRHAKDGDTLFELLSQRIPDIIFLDINMPCKDGVSCIGEIRRHSEYNNIPVIMYTSHRGARHIDECYSNGANFYILKGSTIAELAEKLKKIFSIDWKNYAYYPPKSEFVLGIV